MSNNNSGNSNNNNKNTTNNILHQNLHSPTKLTEFARNFDDNSESLFGRVVSKIQNVYNQSYNTVNDMSSSGTQSGLASKSTFYTENTITKVDAEEDNIPSTMMTSCRPRLPSSFIHSDNASRSISNSVHRIEKEFDTNIRESDLFSEYNLVRTIPNVLKHIVTSKNTNDLRNYKDTELQSFWMPDSKAKECYDCAQKFSTFRRKHHCRLCGQIFCYKCCNQVVPGMIVHCEGDLKVCNYCSKIVLTYLKSSNIGVDLQALQHNLSSKLEKQQNDTSLTPLQQRSQLIRKVSLGYQEERFASQQFYSTLSFDDRKNILQQSNSLIALHEEMLSKLPNQNCGLHLIEFLNTNNKSANKLHAVAILNAMLAAGFLEPIVPDAEQLEFDENLHYKFVEHSKLLPGEINNYQSSNTNSLQFNAVSAEPQQPQPPKSMDISLNVQSENEIELENDMQLTTCTSKLLESYCDYEEQFLAQILHSHHLSPDWSKVLQTLCSTAANHFKPEYCTNDLIDIRNFVNFKKVPGGKRKESIIVHGVAFTKNVVHKEMATHVTQPRILLLQCPIVYERIEGKFVTIETVLLQEKQYLSNVCARIMNFRPNIVLVHKNVAGIAQDILRSNGVTLVLDVKISVMERLSRTLQCDIVNSIESNITMPKLGYCDDFHIRSYRDCNGCSKTLMFFEKLASPRGYTCLLRGANNVELTRVKKVASVLLFSRYNWRLEMSFLLDEFAQPLTRKPPIFDSKESSPMMEIIGTSASKLFDTTEPQLHLFISESSKRCPVERKSEEKMQSIIAKNVSDFTDPLRSARVKKSISLQSEPAVLAVAPRYDNRFRNALSSTLLSISPFLTFPLPYLETEQGRKCALRKLFPAELYYSKLWSKNHSISERPDSTDTLNPIIDKKNESRLLPAHPFLKLKITEPIFNRDIQTQLAEFRSFGGRFPKNKRMLKPKPKADTLQQPQKLCDAQVYKDALDAENHQRLPVLFCSFYYNNKTAPSFCKLPVLLDMKFYGQHDIMLGQFLQRYCCLLNSICPSCKLPMLGHVRRYVHSLGCVQVFLTEDLTRSNPKRIFFTSWCTICNAMTPSVPLSDSSKCLSLAKYLEMRFHGHAYKRRPLTDWIYEKNINSQCDHSLHRDYVHHFSFRGVSAKFQYTAIDVWEASLPAFTIELKQPESIIGLEQQEEIKNFSIRGHEVYTRIHERIADLATESENLPLVLKMKTILSKDQFMFKQKVEIVHTLLTEPKANYYDINDAIIMSKRALADSIEQWGPRLQEIEAVGQKSYSKQTHHIDAGTICTEDLRTEQTDSTTFVAHETDIKRSLRQENTKPVDHPDESTDAMSNSQYVTEKKFSIEQMLASTVSSDKKSIKKIFTHLMPSSSQTNLLQSPFSGQEHLTLPLGTIPIQVRESDLSSIIAYSLTSLDYQRALFKLNIDEPSSGKKTIHTSPQSKRKLQESDSEDCHSPAFSRSSSNIGTVPSNAHYGSPTEADERSKLKIQSHIDNSHILLVFNDNGSQFQCKIYFAREFEKLRATTMKPPKFDRSLYMKLEQNKMCETLRVTQSRTGAEMELIHKPSEMINSARTSPSAVRHVEQTDWEECRNALARSLCNSVQWEARGGKSGSRFCKTIDDRFVLKEMSNSDVNRFQNFAPNYFEYINKCQKQQNPTLLAKIFGVFKVSIKNKEHFIEKSMLVMENLFYASDITNKFDLKGSERNRLVDPSNQIGDIVLLDENLVQMSWSKPLYVLSHTKAVLKQAINRDASFLEKNCVMDYSLLVGLDNNKSMLVLGIIDYIRTFTLDKRFESIVKQSAFLGGSSKSPTVISPERYKQRFIDAMNRYFYTVPDRWEGLSKM